MKSRSWIFAIVLSACATDHAVNPAVLISAEMKIDMASSKASAFGPRFERAEDTAVFHDHFALKHEPIFKVKARLSADTLYFDYQPQGDANFDWSPWAEAEIRMRLDIVGDSLWVRFPIVTQARAPNATEPGFRDARNPLFIRIGI